MLGLAHGSALLAPAEDAFDHRAARLRHAIALVARRTFVDGCPCRKLNPDVMVMKAADYWRARINAISPGIIVTPLAHDQLHGERAEFYQAILKKMPAGRADTG